MLLRTAMTLKDPGAAHAASSGHRNQILRSELCGCFYCLEEFPPTAIGEWCDEDSTGEGQTALCPRCGIDSVIGSASGYPITREFLEAMNRRWF
jgi:hypothetical protein